MPEKIEAVLVELDCLLDTRLGTIARLSPEAAVTALQNGYHNRSIDTFTGVDSEAFKQLYAQRDEQTLMVSTVTNLTLSLARLVAGIADQIFSRPFHNGVEMIVNLYPYLLNEEVQTEIGRAIAARIVDHCPVKLVRITPEELTPQHCKAAYAMMVMYDPHTWMNLHAEAFKYTQIREIALLAPAIYFNKVPTVEELSHAVAKNAHPLQAIQKLAASLVGLDLIDIEYFSVLSVNRLAPDVIQSQQDPLASTEEVGLVGTF